MKHKAHIAGTALILALVLAGPGRADIVALEGETIAEVVQYVHGEAASTDSSVETFPGTVPGLPMQSFAGLGDFQGSPSVGHAGRCVASLEDPTLASGPDPMEIGLEAGAFSTVEGIAYTVEGSVEEAREIVLSSSDLGVGSGETTDVISRVFIEGAVVIWSEGSARDLSGLEGSFSFSVEQDFGSNGGAVVTSHSLSVLGSSNGEISVSEFQLPGLIVGGPEVLESGNSEVDAVLADLATLGTVHVIVVPRFEFAYTYPASPDEEFVLRAFAGVEAVNLPEGTGIAVVFGRSAEAIATVFTPVLGHAKAATLQDAVARVMAAGGDEPPPGSGPLCGAGAFGLPLLTAFSLVGGRRWRRYVAGRAVRIADRP
jgi:hypothetical protein